MNECRIRVWRGIETRLWFWSCESCSGYEGGYLTEAEANEGWERHAEKAKDRWRRRTESRAAETIKTSATDLL